MTWLHWMLYDIPPSAPRLPEGGRPLPAGTREGLSDWGRQGVGGPCSPVGRHRDVFELHVLDKLLPAPPRSTQAAVEQAMCGHGLAQAELIATYRKRWP